MNLNPVTLKKLKRFKSIKRGYYSFVIFSALVVISLLAELLVNSRALAVSYQGELYFPTYGDVIPGQQFGLDYEYETNYRQLQAKLAQEAKGDWVLLPLVLAVLVGLGFGAAQMDRPFTVGRGPAHFP